MARPSPVRHLLHLRAEIEGISPPIVRELTIDRDAGIARLRCALQAAFGLTECSRYEFTESPDPCLPAGVELATLSEMDLYEHERRIGKQGPSLQPSRRWGDRWTMIDTRDPRTVFDVSAPISALFREEPWERAPQPRFFRCDHVDQWSSWPAGHPWWLRIEAIADEIARAEDPVVRVVAGVGAPPFDERMGAHRYATLLAHWRDPGSAEHTTARTEAATAVGPWAHFDPDEFDLTATRTDVENAMSGGECAGERPGVTALLQSVRRTARPGLRRHLERTGIGLPAVITADDAEVAVRLFRQALQACMDAAGRPCDEVQAAVGELAGGSDAAGALLERMRRLRLIYRRSGCWQVRREVRDLVPSPVRLWHHLARAVAGAQSSEGRLILLAIADGTIADVTGTLDRIAAARKIDEQDWDAPRTRRHGAGLRVALDELQRILACLVPDADATTVDLGSEIAREFARACLRLDAHDAY